VILSIVNKAVSNFFHFSAENNYLFGIHKIIALAELIGINSTVTTILQVGESVEIRETNTASIYLLSIRASASNTEYLATYILAWASIYAAGVTKLSEYSYTSNVTIEVSRTGTDKYKITYKAGNVSSIELKYSLRKLIL
jgi:hypothetical protein